MAFFWSLCHQLWRSGEKGRGGIPICLSFSHHPHSDEIDNERILLQYLSKVKQFSIIWKWKSSGHQKYGKYQNESNNIKNESDQLYLMQGMECASIFDQPLDSDRDPLLTQGRFLQHSIPHHLHPLTTVLRLSLNKRKTIIIS